MKKAFLSILFIVAMIEQSAFFFNLCPPDIYKPERFGVGIECLIALFWVVWGLIASLSIPISLYVVLVVIYKIDINK